MSLTDAAKQLGRGSEIICDWLGNDGRTVLYETAQNRADVCTGRISGKACPHNVPENIVAGFVGDSVKRLLEIKNKANLRVQGEKSLRGCDVCGCNLRLKIHVPFAHIKKFTPQEELDRHPEFCWMQKENKTEIK